MRGWSAQRRDNYVDRCADITLKNTTIGFSVMLRDAEYREHYLGTPPTRGQKGPRKDSRYGLCFRSCLTWLPIELRKALRRDDWTINIVLERGHANAGDAERIFNELKREPDYGRYLAGIAQHDKKALNGLQAADSMAYIAYRGERDIYPIIDQSASSDYFDDRRTLKSRVPLYRCRVEVEYMKALRERAETRTARKAGLNPG